MFRNNKASLTTIYYHVHFRMSVLRMAQTLRVQWYAVCVLCSLARLTHIFTLRPLQFQSTPGAVEDIGGHETLESGYSSTMPHVCT